MSNLNLIMSIIKFFKDETKRGDLSPGAIESLDVAIQCLQAAYDIDADDPSLVCLHGMYSLPDIFNKEVNSSKPSEKKSSDAIQQAEVLKDVGNNLMKDKEYAKAIDTYTQAINLDGNNAIYYGNRAAAYARLNDFENSIKDCQKALAIDPKYAKAYGRMGLAYGCLNQHSQAVESFKKALEIDPTNEEYRSCLKKEEEKTVNGASGEGNPMRILNDIDWQGVFNNPSFRNLTSTLLQDPSIINAFSCATNQSNPSAGNVDPRNFEGNPLLDAGRYFAAQMQAANPDLVEQLRQLATRNPNPRSGENPDCGGKESKQE